MNWIDYLRNFEEEDFLEILDKYEALGPLPGIFLPFVEAFLPILPLIVIVLANAAAYGLWKGFLFSWIGVTLGSIIIFSLARKYGHRFYAYILRRSPKGKAFFEWIERKGFTPIFILSCFPFSPSFVVNVVSGMSKIPFHTFLVAVLTGKAFMLFLVSLVGFDIFGIFHNPWRFVLVTSIFALVWLIGRALEKRFKKA